jgi:hypothetical protein
MQHMTAYFESVHGMHAKRAPARLMVRRQSELFLPLPAAHSKHQHHDASVASPPRVHPEYTHVLRYIRFRV